MLLDIGFCFERVKGDNGFAVAFLFAAVRPIVSDS